MQLHLDHNTEALFYADHWLIGDNLSLTPEKIRIYVFGRLTELLYLDKTDLKFVSCVSKAFDQFN